MKAYIASSEKHLGKIQEDVYLRDECINRSLVSEIATLSEIVNTATYPDVVILKSIWGYYTNPESFLGQLDVLNKRKVNLVNDFKYISWNIDKRRYLEEIRHFRIVPTVALGFEAGRTIKNISDVTRRASRKLGANTLVIKPGISESGYLTIRYGAYKNNDDVIAMVQKHPDVEFIAQPFRPTFSRGEVSIIVLGGTQFYGIRRFPGVFSQKSDPEYIPIADVPLPIKKEATLLGLFFKEKFGGTPIICRIDFLEVKTGYEILEVELIDPDLFFRNIPDDVRIEAINMIIKSFKAHV